MTQIFFSLFSESSLAKNIVDSGQFQLGNYILHEFPDRESHIQITTEVKDRKIIVLCDLHYPNNKIIPLIFFSETARELGAKSITLIAPYLTYMRQDMQFKAGEGITSKYFAKLISNYFDRLITIEPHLHRYQSLNEIYNIPTTTISATTLIAEFIKNNISQALLIGPDSESANWIAKIARELKVPYIILEKVRHGDKQVAITLPDVSSYKKFKPVIVDDIISTARTMIETSHQLQSQQLAAPYCIGVHALFVNDAYKKLLDSGVTKVVTCNTIQHQTNMIDLSKLLLKCLSS